MPETPEESLPEKRAQSEEPENKFLRAARIARQYLPGDSALGDSLSTAGDNPSHVLARRMAEARPRTESVGVARELGLGALQVWQALSEAQGRGRGEVELTIVFTDLVGFSSYALDVGDEPALELLREVDRVSDAAISAHGGDIVKRLGDGVMAIFIQPRAAVDAALEARAGVARLEFNGYRPRLRAGLHIGKPRKVGGDYLGVDVNVAARVAEAARDEVLVSNAVSERIDDGDLKLKRRRGFKAKGAPSELEVFSVQPI
jgi:adenylate cyclase